MVTLQLAVALEVHCYLHKNDISKTSLKIYMFLLESSRPQGVREIARSLNIPVSTVYYHLKRLEELGLVTHDPRGYQASRTIEIEGFVVLGKRVIPRLLVYSMFFLGILLGELVVILLTRAVNPDRIAVLLTSLLAFAILLVEGLAARSKVKS